MASAVLTSRNESSSSFMGKTPFSNSRLIPNSNSLSSRRQTQANFSQIDSDELPSVSQSMPDDASSFNRKSYISSATKNSLFNQGDYLSFDIASYQRKELIKLKKRWIAELERIRFLANRIESGEFQLKSSSSLQHQSTPRKQDKKRALPLNPGRDSKRLALTENIVHLMKICGQVLTKLMKHKRGYHIFNSPVDVVALGLHDYNHIVKQPMDLGTVKSKLGKNLYDTPLDFAADVRLTFKNAMLYNPKGHEVHELADQLLFRFNDLFRPIYQKYLAEQQEQPPPPPQQKPQQRRDASEDLRESSWNRNPGPDKKVKKTTLTEIAKKSEIVHVPATSQNLAATNPPPMAQSPETTPSPIRLSPAKPLIKTKQPKPKAKDPNKREMTLEEKHKLGAGLQSLPDEKMTQVVHIIKKRNEHLTDDCDEIELDIEAVDRETLWELDRLVTNWKKMVSKISRQALIDSSAATSDGGMVAVRTESDVGIAPVKKAKKREGGDEDVDIGDDMPMSSFPPVEIEKDDGGHGRANNSSSSSSGSSSDSSSSSDSGSGSCSGSDSGADNPESKDFSRI